MIKNISILIVIGYCKQLA